MTHDYPKATKICIWYRTPEDEGHKRWMISPMEPTWWHVVGWAWYPLDNGDEININKGCTIDISGRLIIKNDNWIFVHYGEDDDVKVKINRKYENYIPPFETISRT